MVWNQNIIKTNHEDQQHMLFLIILLVLQILTSYSVDAASTKEE